jgi:signal transduction histidine kinase
MRKFDFSQRTAWIAFGIAMALLVLPDLLGFWQVVHGSRFPLEFEIVGTVTDAVIFTFVVILLRQDVVRRRQAEEGLRVANAELIAANQFKVHLLGMAAHDLKNPLTAIRSLALLLKNPGGDTQSVRETAVHIESTCNEMLGLIHDLLDTAALEGASLKLDPALHDFGELVNTAIEAARPLAAHKQQRIEVAPGPLAIVSLDARRFIQVLNNLLGNAIKFSPMRTTITIHWEADRERVHLSITDQGPGLTQTDLARLFERFRPLTARPTAGESSSGLGLWIVRQLVALHGGIVWATSRGQGQGATFHVELPVGDEAHLEAQPVTELAR